ncbi:MAG TPA: sugar ABC transporter substrate-binding protein [Candidatus Paceibacterota bacterium]|nr:sugar ABC transporter substrate-binding protein [Candidatus Paceibacterota bacterium]
MNKKLYIIVGVLAAIVLALFFYLVFSGDGVGGGQNTQRVQLTFWGVYEEQAAFRDSITAFRALYPNVSITYTLINYADYETRLLQALASGTGPDVWMIHNTWLPQHQDKLLPLPAQMPDSGEPLLTLPQFKQQFADIAEKDLTDQGRIYALPLYVDTLALYYNKDIFNSAGIARAPRTWEEFNEAVKQLTLIDEGNNITRAGAAIGTAKNINRSTDILSLLFLQSGVPLTDKEKGEADLSNRVNNQDLGLVALRYYTDFADPAKQVYTWNDLQHYSIDAFTEGRAVMMFNYSHQAEVLRDKAPRLNFAVAPMPQLDPNQRLNYGSYWAVGVSKMSPAPNTAWRFAHYLTSFTGVVPYLNYTRRPTARRDLIELQKKEGEELAVFDDQVLSATSWWQPDSQKAEQVMADLIDDVNFSRATPERALRSAEDKLNASIQRR